MQLENLIIQSEWWKSAENYPDRHFPPDSNIKLSNHLQEIRIGVDLLLNFQTDNKYLQGLHSFLKEKNVDLEDLREILILTALLHDIGKPYDDKWHIVKHDMFINLPKQKHEFISEIIAFNILPNSYSLKKNVVVLVKEHDKPYRWYKNHQYKKFIPNWTDWLTLDTAIFENAKGVGIIYLILFKMIDTHGHFHLNDVLWFIETANRTYFNFYKYEFPMPDEEILRSLVKSGF